MSYVADVAGYTADFDGIKMPEISTNVKQKFVIIFRFFYVTNSTYYNNLISNMTSASYNTKLKVFIPTPDCPQVALDILSEKWKYLHFFIFQVSNFILE